MKTELTVDGAGRIVIPQPVRRHFNLTRGAALDMEVDEHAIVLRPHVGEPSLVDEGGLLVHQGKPSGDLLQAVEHARDQRDRDVVGPAR